MSYHQRAVLWLTMLLLSIGLTGCFDVKSKLKVFPSGEAEMTTTVDTSRADALVSSFKAAESNISCEQFVEKVRQDPKWSCEQTGPSSIRARRHYTQAEAATFMEINSGLFSSSYKVYPTTLIGPISEDSKDASLDEKAKVAAMYKGLGVLMMLEVEMPGEITAIGNSKPANNSGALTIDLLDPMVWTDGYSIQSKEGKWAQGLGVVLLAALVVAAGFAARRKTSLPESFRKFVLPVAVLVALLIVALPMLLSSLFTPIPAPEDQKAPVVATAPTPVAVAPAPIAAPETFPPAEPAAVEAPPLASDTSDIWTKLASQHAHVVMDHPSFHLKFRQLLGNDYDAVKNSVSVSSIHLESGYLIASGNAPNSGGYDMAIWAIDTQDGNIYAVWKLNNQLKVYGTSSEQRLPAPLYQWYKEMGGPN